MLSKPFKILFSIKIEAQKLFSIKKYNYLYLYLFLRFYIFASISSYLPSVRVVIFKHENNYIILIFEMNLILYRLSFINLKNVKERSNF